MVDANSAVVFERLATLLPKGKRADFARVQGTECIGVAEIEIGPIASPWLRLEERVADPRRRLVAINVFGNHVEVAAHQHRQIFIPPGTQLLHEPVHPGALVRKILWSSGV